MHAGGSRRSSTAVFLALLLYVALLLFAHSPALRAGLYAWDYAALLDERPAPGTWSLAAHVRRGLPLPGQRALAWRLESLLVLVGMALAARAFFFRVLEPRVGRRAARAAALVTALLATLHPAAPAAIAELAGRGEAVGLLLGFAAGALFLRGRQDERSVLTAASFVTLVVAACASSVAVLLGPGFAAAEYTSVRRHRRRSLRLRTAATTAAIFGAGAMLPHLMLPGGTSPSLASTLSVGEGLREHILGLAAELGVAATLPGTGLGALAALFAGALLLLALQPAFRAARHAPRLWGGILVSWSAVLLVALLRAEGGGSGTRLLALAVWSAGLGLTITALATAWRAVLAATLAVGWAILAHAGARPWLVGSGVLAGFHGEISRLAPPPPARVLVLDPPSVRGLPPLTRELGWLFHGALGHGAEGSGFDPRRIQGLTSAAFLALARCDTFERQRREELVVLHLARGQDGAERYRAVRVPAPSGRAPAVTTWRGDLKFLPDAPLDPLQVGLVRLVAEVTTAPREIERLAWRTPAAEAARAGDSGSCTGRVSERGGRRVAEFDLSRSLDWRLAGSVGALLVKNGVSDIERGELLASLAEIPGLPDPVASGGDWRFDEPRLEGEVRGGRFVLGLLAQDDLEQLELPLETDPDDPGSLLARGAQRFVARHARAGAGVAWELEYRIGEHALYRSRGSVPLARQ